MLIKDLLLHKMPAAVTNCSKPKFMVVTSSAAIATINLSIYQVWLF